MIVWGGFGAGPAFVNTGGQYDPADSWLATNTVNAPTAREEHTAIWTGSRMVVWGGGSNTNTGGRYDPVGDSWMAGGTTTTNAPSGRVFHSAIWTGSRMIVWGGNDGVNYTNSGGQYDPVGDAWSATAASDVAPTGRRSHTAVWTGSRMIVWGGDSGSTFFNTGGQYDPVGDSWTATTTIGAPIPRTNLFIQSAVWTGTRMIVWGGYGPPYLNTGGRYQNLSLYVKN
jgi:hypothetical protein